MTSNYLIQTVLVFSIFYISIFLYSVWFDTCEQNNFTTCEANYWFSYKEFSKLQNSIKAGDILLFSAYDHWSIARLRGNIFFQHYAVVVEIDNKLYSLECTSDILLQSKNKIIRSGPGVYLTELEHRILTYPGNILLASMKNSLDVEQKRRLARFAVECTDGSHKYLSDFKVFLNMYHGVDYDSSKQYTCISFINYVFRQIIKCLDGYPYVSPDNLCNFYSDIILKKREVWDWPIEIIHESLHISNQINDKNKRPLIYTQI